MVFTSVRRAFDRDLSVLGRALWPTSAHTYHNDVSKSSFVRVLDQRPEIRDLGFEARLPPFNIITDVWEQAPSTFITWSLNTL